MQNRVLGSCSWVSRGCRGQMGLLVAVQTARKCGTCLKAIARGTFGWKMLKNIEDCPPKLDLWENNKGIFF